MGMNEPKYQVGDVLTRNINGYKIVWTINAVKNTEFGYKYDLLRQDQRGQRKLITNLEEIYVAELPKW